MLAVCNTCQEIHICYKEDYNYTKNIVNNFNIWYQKADSLGSLNSQIPVSICHHCIPYPNVEHTHCELCLSYMPTNSDQYPGIHQFVDTNYQKHYICNICANKHWSSSLVCLCGKTVHEVDMHQLKPKAVACISRDLHPEIFEYLEPKLNLSENEDVYMYLTKACKSCSLPTDALNSDFIEKNMLQNLTLDKVKSVNNNIDFHNPNKELKLVETYYENDHGEIIPAVLLAVKITNPGYVGYFVKSNDLF